MAPDDTAVHPFRIDVSDEALADPYEPDVTLAPGLPELDVLRGVVLDTHFGARDRMGRLLAFTARAMVDEQVAHPLGIGVDERTALLVDGTGTGTVIGAGSVYVLAPTAAPAKCISGKPLAWADVPLYELHAADTIALPAGTTTVTASTLSASGGDLVPSDPY